MWWQKIPKRIIVIGLCSIGVIISYADRSNMAVAIVFISREFGWPFAKQGLVLSSFFVGYIVTQVLGGTLADKFGSKQVLGGGEKNAAACWTIFTLLTPGAAKSGFIYLILCRICLGIGEGLCLPSIHSLIASWVRVDERSTAIAVVTVSCSIGIVLAMPLSTFLESIGGWESIFWAFGATGIIWSLTWQTFGGSNPLEYSGIKEEEINWILEDNMKYDFADVDYHIIQSEDDDSEVNDVGLIEEDCATSSSFLRETCATYPIQRNLKSTKPIPWRQILSQREVWAILISQFFLPYAVQGITGLFVGIFADYMIYKMKIRVINVRRTAQLIGSFGVAIFLLLAVYLASTPLQGIILITIGLGLNSFTIAGVSVSQLDIAPRYAGIIFGLGNTLGVIPAIFGVALTGWILDISGNQWNIVWTFAAIMYFIGSSVFVTWVGDEIVID
ncbi:9576_t:CDS:2 [Cetraspora pellucida]|uniref:9576_t:CDS:1 n=1 Tax=Cetraspora pellucida TaxID=1433469 RepID=A0ACA9L3S0_9GLOM|nr:9576_t:CDS:2 [Cetraspora pellucida]